MKFKGALFLSLAACIWGGMYVVSKYVMDVIPPMTLLFSRYLVASVVLGVIFYKKKLPLLPQGQKKNIFQIGLIGYFLSVGAQFIGVSLSSAHMGAMITTLSPVFLSLFAFFLLKQKMVLREVLSIVAALVGVMIVIGLPGDGQEAQSPFMGNLFLLLAAVFWGYYSVLAQKVAPHYSALQVTTWGVWIATLIVLPFPFLEADQWNFSELTQWSTVLSILYLGVISTAVAFFCWNQGLAMLPAHQAGPFFFFQPIVGSLLGWFFLDEVLSPSFFMGSFLILLAVYLAITKPAESNHSDSSLTA